LKVKIPRHFKIGATSASVSLSENLKSDEGFAGSFNNRNNELRIDSQIGGEKRDKILGHEINEVIKENYELEVSERDMSCIANGWVEFLQQLGIEFDWHDISGKEEPEDKPEIYDALEEIYLKIQSLLDDYSIVR